MDESETTGQAETPPEFGMTIALDRRQVGALLTAIDAWLDEADDTQEAMIDDPNFTTIESLAEAMWEVTSDVIALRQVKQALTNATWC